MNAALVWCPCPDEESAGKLADCLLDDGLIACANIFGPVRSRFLWDGERHESQEVGVLMKTTGALLDRACARAAELHPYDTPAIVGWHADAAAIQTNEWLGGTLDKSGD